MSSFPVPPILPAPPQLPAPGPFQGYNMPSQGVAPAPSSTPANLLQGVNALVQQFQQQRETQRNHYASQAQQDIQNMLIGLPIDVKKTAQLMKKAGMNIDFNTPLPQPAAGPTTVTGQIPGGNGIPPMSTSTQFPGPPAQPPNPTMPQSVWDRIKAASGWTPPVINPNSPGMAALQRLQQIGQGNLGQQEKAQTLAGGQQDIEAQTQALIKSGLAGNQDAWTALRQLQGKETPMDQIYRVARSIGMPDQQTGEAVLTKELGLGVSLEQRLQLAKSYSQYFGNDLTAATKYVNDIITKGSSDLKPDTMNIDDKIKVAQRTNDIQKQYPTAPLNLARSMAMAEVSGNSGYANRISSMLEKFPTEGQLTANEKDRNYNLELRKFGEQMNEFKQNHELAVVQAVRTAMGEQFDQGMKILDSKQSSDADKEAAMHMIADSAQKLKGIKIDGVDIGSNITVDRVRHWNSLINGTLEFHSTNPEDVKASLLNNLSPPPGVVPGSEEYKAWMKKAQDYAEGLLMSKTKSSTALGKGMDVRKLSTGEPFPTLPPMTPGPGPFAAGPATQGQQ